MGVALLLLAAFLLLAVGDQIWSVLVSGILTSFTKSELMGCLGLAGTKVSITVTAVKLSIWPHAWKFLRSPTQEKLFHLEVSSIHLQVAVAVADAGSLHARTPKTRDDSMSQPFWLTLDTSVGLKNFQHPMWDGIRAWMSSLLFVCRFANVIELSVGSIAVDVVRKDRDNATPVISIQVIMKLDTRKDVPIRMNCTYKRF
ncbi:hypothetical protein BBJ28_00004210 [Nothophytophthora sp. Chile5]|nr:hypothetical protein BBJ28_00004210 [Nothophytophthora sp. Chile5]